MARWALWTIVAVFLCAVGVISAFEDDCERLMIVVGAVDSSSARVLVASPGGPLRLRMVVNGGQEEWINANEEPYVLVMSELSSGTTHTVQFTWRDGECTAAAEIHTPPSEGEKETRIAVVSCNRYVEDQDGVMWARLAEEIVTNNVRMTVHLGDQIYADHIPGEQQESEGYCATLEKFRRYYAVSWGHTSAEKVLRSTANYMLPDDHEVANNFAASMWNPTFFSDGVTAVDASDEDRRHQYLARAGIQAFYEYQVQLTHACGAWLDDLRVAGDCNAAGDSGDTQDMAAIDRLLLDERRPRLHLSMDMAGSRLLFIDARMERTLAFEEEHPLLGADQLEWAIGEVREAYDSEEVKRVIMFSSVPLLFQSPAMAEFAWIFEGEKYPSHETMHPDTIPLLEALLSDGYEKALLVAGDLHMYYTGSVCSTSGACVDSLLTSGMTRRSTALGSWHLLFYNWICFFFNTGSLHGTTESFFATFEDSFFHNNFLVLHLGPHGVTWTPFLSELSTALDIRQRIFFATPLIAKTVVTITSLLFLLPILQL